MGNLKIDKTPRAFGLAKLAEELGVSRSHLSRVWHGERRSPRCEAALVEAGFPPRRRRRKGA